MKMLLMTIAVIANVQVLYSKRDIELNPTLVG